MNRSLRTGAVVAQYGRFRLHILEAIIRNQLVNTTRYEVSIETNVGAAENLGSIRSEESDFPHFLVFVKDWLIGQHYYIAQIQWNLDEAQVSLTRDSVADELSRVQARFHIVEDALRELEPGYTFDPAAHPIAVSSEEIGPLAKRYGEFALYTLIESKDNQLLPPTRYRLFVQDGTNDALPLATIAITESDCSHVLELAREWVEANSGTLEILRRKYREATDAQEKQQYGEIMQNTERFLVKVESALKDLERENQNRS